MKRNTRRPMRRKKMNPEQVQSKLHADEEMSAKDDDLRRLIDKMPVSVLIADADNHKLEFANQAFLTDNGFGSFEEACRMNLSPILEQVFRLWKGVSVSFNYVKMRHPEGEVYQKVSAEKVRYHNKDCVVLITEDITTRLKENQMLSRVAEKEKEANMLKSMFLANMSHEIRTPMNAIIGLSQIAMLKDQTEENKNYFYGIKSAAKNLLSIINDILDFAQIEAEKIDLVEEEFDLEDTIANAFVVAVERMEDKPLEILLDMDMNIPCYLFGDSTRLWQILKNILDNAVKYTREGRVVLKVEMLMSRPDCVTLCFKVRDTGFGMSHDQMARLFIPFEELHRDGYKNQGTGTGLGMSITKQLVDLMQGDIEVSSDLDVGTEFSVRLSFIPSANKETIGDISSGYLKASSQVGPVLLIDDDEVALQIMSRIFEQLGIEAVCVHNNAEAFEMLERYAKQGTPFQTVIVDDLLWDQNGLDTAGRVKQTYPDIRIFLTSHSQKQMLPQSPLSKAGVENVIEKPFILSEFVRMVCISDHQVAQQEQKQTTYSKARVLLCEDNEINQIVAVGMLEVFGIRPTVVENGQEALDLLQNETFDFIFMDIIMPVMDGHEATRMIRRSKKPYRDIPICALTANVMPEQVRECFDGGMNAHIEKPIRFEKIADVLAELLPDLAD